MAVYKRSYRRFGGGLTPEWSRFLILPRYAYQDVLRSRLLLAFFVVCFAFPVGAAVLIYLRHNLSAMGLLNLSVADLISIDNKFFVRFLSFQGTMAFLLSAFVGPGLVSADLANNALPLYFCRPFSRTEYVVGKMCVLVILLSLITWIPGLLLFLLQSNLEGTTWLYENLWIAAAVFLGSWIWILILSLLTLALSAWVKWRPIAGALLFGVFFVAAGFGKAINNIFYTRWGNLINMGELIDTVWSHLFGLPSRTAVPIWSAWVALLAICILCLGLLYHKVRAYEVVR